MNLCRRVIHHSISHPTKEHRRSITRMEGRGIGGNLSTRSLNTLVRIFPAQSGINKYNQSPMV